jgi:hypothetical protein
MILSGLRPGEALYAKFDEIDFDARTWTIPGRNDDPVNGRMKAGANMLIFSVWYWLIDPPGIEDDSALWCRRARHHRAWLLDLCAV